MYNKNYEAEWKFFCRLIQNFHLNLTIVDQDTQEMPEFDMGLRRMIYGEKDYFKIYSGNVGSRSVEPVPDRKIIRLKDEYMCSYIYFKHPGEKGEFVIIGPYTQSVVGKKQVLDYAEKLKLPPEMLPALERYYCDVPIIIDDGTLYSIVDTLGEVMWEGIDNFTVESVERYSRDSKETAVLQPVYQAQQESQVSMHMLEERYKYEGELMRAVSLGQTQKAEILVANGNFVGIEQRTSDQIRNIKNYCIILNTLLRKAAEMGSVHPFHIDNLSSRYARRIELIISVEEGNALQKEMVHKYCLLVKNHSMKGYSLLVRKVLIHIDSDLTADLSLKTQAELLNVNASYFSTLFKKETGYTLTDYVKKKRIEHAVLLLNSTNLQIQTVAQYCGIPDVNYFTKIFKKYIGKTPKEYRESVNVQNISV